MPVTRRQQQPKINLESPSSPVLKRSKRVKTSSSPKVKLPRSQKSQKSVNDSVSTQTTDDNKTSQVKDHLQKENSKRKSDLNEEHERLLSSPVAQATSTSKTKDKKMKNRKRLSGKRLGNLNSENSTKYEVGFDNSKLFKLIINLLDQVQEISESKLMEPFLRKLRLLYFDKEPGRLGIEKSRIKISRKQAAAREHQAKFANYLWIALHPTFREEANYYTNNIFSFAQSAILTFGSLKDLSKYIDFKGSKEEGLEIYPPLYIRILEHILHDNSSDFSSVRQRMMEMMRDILKMHSHDILAHYAHIEEIKTVLLKRSRDKAPYVRAYAIKCFEFFQDDVLIRKATIFSAKYDSAPEVRKNALVHLNVATVRSNIFFEKAFDTSDSVKSIAFQCISKIQLSRLAKRSQNHKVLHWGLRHCSSKVRDIMRDILLPSWLEQSEGKLHNLFATLDTSTSPKTSMMILECLYPKCTLDEFRQIDLSFLSADKVIPLDDLTVEKCQLWYLLLSRFSNIKECNDSLSPEAIIFVGYIYKLLKLVFKESEDWEKNQDETEANFDNKYHLCLALILKISEFVHFEEGIRRKLESLLQKILLDTRMSDVIVINVTVDIIASIVDKKELDDFMTLIMQEVFDFERVSELGDSPHVSDDGCFGNLSNVDQNANGKGNGTFGGDGDRLIVTPEASPPKSPPLPNDEHMSVEDEREGGVGVRKESVSSTSSMEIESGEKNESRSSSPTSSMLELMTEDESGDGLPPTLCQNATISSGGVGGNSEKSDQTLIGTRGKKQMVKRQMSIGDKIMQLKSEAGELTFKRHLLIGEKDKASASVDYLRCHELQLEINKCTEEERRLKEEAARLEQMDQLMNIEEEEEGSQSASDGVLRTAMGGEGKRLSPVPPLEFDEGAFTTRDEEDKENKSKNEISFTVTSQSVLKGLVMLHRYLNHSQKLTDFIRRIFDNHIFQCLEDEDTRVRAATAALICIYGLLDKKEAHLAMMVSLQAYIHDINPVKLAGFKNVVDLVVEYGLNNMFKLVSENVILPHPFSDPNEPLKTVEKNLIELLGKCGGDSPIEDDYVFTTKISGLIKLMIRQRISCREILVNFLCIWINPANYASEACFKIAQFIPIYCSMSSENSIRVFEAFLICIKKIAEKESEEWDEGLEFSNLSKLTEFIFSSSSLDALRNLKEPHKIHDVQATVFLKEIKSNFLSPSAIHIARALKFFEITTESVAIEMVKTVDEILLLIEEHKSPVKTGHLKIQLNGFKRNLCAIHNLNDVLLFGGILSQSHDQNSQEEKKDKTIIDLGNDESVFVPSSPTQSTLDPLGFKIKDENLSRANSIGPSDEEEEISEEVPTINNTDL